MNETLEARQVEIVEEFESFEDWMDKYEYVIELGKSLNSMPESAKLDEHLIRGCQSRVWLVAVKNDDGTIRFEADSDAIITKGLVALMVRALNGLTPKAVAEADLWFIAKIGLDTHLSPTRANGLQSMVQQMRHYGLAFQAKG
jgi:cysteine desulfuration protein SufE